MPGWCAAALSLPQCAAWDALNQIKAPKLVIHGSDD